MTDEIKAPPVRLSFSAAMLRVSPPWLRRLVGGAIMQGVGDTIENEVDRNVEGLRLRFPDAGVDEDAIGYLGRERRILRGPGELGSTFAIRLRKWWDSHRIRGNEYALLDQMHAYFLATNPTLEIVYIANSGTADAKVDAAGVITRDNGVSPGWTGDGENPPYWARFFLFLQFDGTVYQAVLLDGDGNPILNMAGDPVLVTISLYALTAADLEEICAVPHEWSAAHIDRIYIVLLPVNGIAWGYPATLQWGDVGRTWGGDLAVVFTC